MANDKRHIVLIAHNLRSCHNVGSLFRTAEGLGINKVYLTGYTPYPSSQEDTRLPHIASKVQKQIDKTALGAEKTIAWEYCPNISTLIKSLKDQSYTIAALEQTASSINITTWESPQRLALIVGRETEGIEPEVIESSDIVLELPMFGKKESFNVTQAAAMALFHVKFYKR